MADDSYDILLSLYRPGNLEVLGESSDAIASEEGAKIEIDDFTLDLDKASAGSEAATTGVFDDSRITSRLQGVDKKLQQMASHVFEAMNTRLESLEHAVREAEREKASQGDVPMTSNAKPVGRSCSFQIKKLVDRSSPQLYRAYCEGQLATPTSGDSGGGGGDSTVKKTGFFSRGVVYVRKATGGTDNVFLQFDFTGLNVKSYSLSVSDVKHNETVDFTFDKVTITYRTQGQTGALDATSEDRIVTIDLTKDADEQDD